VTSDPLRKRAQWRLLGFSLLLVVLIGLVLAWRWTPLREFIDPRLLAQYADALRGHPLAPLIVIAGFVLVGVLLLPVTPMVIVAVGAFSPLWGFVCALLGVTVLAALAFAVGRFAGRAQLERLAGSPVHRVSRRLGDAGVLTITMTRMVPIAHFTIVSLTAGASHIRWRDFLAGTVLGMTPGVAAIALLYESAVSVAREPAQTRVAMFAVIAVAILAVLLALRAWVRRSAGRPFSDESR
jgi:uncharacterized membrane protein YdjX (TVP38/TMEM64 family)